LQVKITLAQVWVLRGVGLSAIVNHTVWLWCDQSARRRKTSKVRWFFHQIQ